MTTLDKYGIKVPVSFVLMTETSTERGEALKAYLDGQSYMNLNVLLCAVGGCFEIRVESTVADNVDELKDMTLFILACKTMDALTGD